ncbi:MAG: hypothetical protein ALECFALPRED_009556, partial [Alectoria fallacina]
SDGDRGKRTDGANSDSPDGPFSGFGPDNIEPQTMIDDAKEVTIFPATVVLQ